MIIIRSTVSKQQLFTLSTCVTDTKLLLDPTVAGAESRAMQTSEMSAMTRRVSLCLSISDPASL